MMIGYTGHGGTPPVTPSCTRSTAINQLYMFSFWLHTCDDTLRNAPLLVSVQFSTHTHISTKYLRTGSCGEEKEWLPTAAKSLGG